MELKTGSRVAEYEALFQSLSKNERPHATFVAITLICTAIRYFSLRFHYTVRVIIASFRTENSDKLSVMLKP